jgi:hypothetical protein
MIDVSISFLNSNVTLLKLVMFFLLYTLNTYS